jgi:class 3 adenylate cyclase
MSEQSASPALARVSLWLDAGESRGYIGTPARFTIGWVDFGGWLVDRVAAPQPIRPDSAAYLIKVNYDVGLAPGAPPPAWVEAGFEFEDEDVAVVDALPRRVRASADARSYLLTEHLAFQEADVAVPEGFPFRGGIVVPPLDPDIDAFGIGKSRVRWRHTTVPGTAGPVGSQTGWLVLLAPARSGELHVVATARHALAAGSLAGRRPTAAPAAFTIRLPAGPPAPDSPVPLSVRMGFVVDVVGYSQRTEPHQYALQQRLAALITEVMGEIGVRLEPEYVQGTGDGMNVFLPVDTDISRTLPALLASVGTRLRRDNQQHQDRIRLRVATDLGPVRPAATGFSGNTIIAFGRLVDSAPIRDAMAGHPDADLAVLVSDWLYQYFVSQGYGGLDPAEFTRVQAVVKSFQADAWLWIGPSGLR